MEDRPIKVYRTMLSAGVMTLLPVGIAVALLYALLALDVQWWHWVILSIGIIIALYFAASWLRHIGDRIYVYERGLRITKAERKTKGGEWETVRDVYIPWRDIRRFLRTTEPVWFYLHFRRWIWIYIRGGIAYRISPDLYDTFFLEKKLRRYWEENR